MRAEADPGELENAHGAHNYHPLPVVITEGQGVWVTDRHGRRYLDCLSAYSALNFGHRHPTIIAAVSDQLSRLTLTSRAFHHDQLGPFCADLAELAGMDMVLPMNTGAEAVETAIKVARKWGYEVKGVPDGQASIVVAEGNFHGRTTTLISLSTDPQARGGFGPYTPGFRTVPYGSSTAMAAAIDDTTVAVLLEPVQGESGVVVPPTGYLREVRATCTERNVLMLVDEVQSGLGRTGYTFACDREEVRPDVYSLGKALGGGVLPLSAVVADANVLEVLRPGQHGSTFGGNPLAAAAGLAVVALLKTGEYQDRSRRLGERLHQGLLELRDHGITAVRCAGLWAGVDIDPSIASGRMVCERLLTRGMLVKDTHGSTVRLAPPLVIEESELDWALEQFGEVLRELVHDGTGKAQADAVTSS